MNHWNIFFKPSTGREFFPHFWVEILSKDFTVEKSFSRFFFVRFLLLREIFSLTFGWKYYLKTSLWKNLFQDFFRTFSSTARVFTLILGCNFYLKDFNM